MPVYMLMGWHFVYTITHASVDGSHEFVHVLQFVVYQADCAQAELWAPICYK